MNLTGGVLLQASGDALPQKYIRIKEIIEDYNPELELAWIPPSTRDAEDKEPFAIFHNSSKGRYLVGTFREDQMNHQIISHLFKIDNKNRNVLSDLEADEAARKLIQYKEQMDEWEEKKDFMKSVITTKKHYYRHNGRVYQ